MKILAIEASGLVASVAVTEDDMLKAEFTVNNKLTHSQTLLPMLKEMLHISGESLDDIDAIAVSAGPGSFTGLRIGAATAKGLALAKDIPIIKISSLEALMYELASDSHDVICPIMDARRGQVYCAAWRDGEKLIPEKACAIEELLAELENIGRDIVFSGDGVPVYSKMIESGFQSKEIRIFFADSPNNRQRAASVAALGMKKYREWLENNGLDSGTIKKNGAGSISCFDDTVMNSDDFVPEYLRKPQAEREKDAGLLEDPGLKSLRKIANGAKD